MTVFKIELRLHLLNKMGTWADRWIVTVTESYSFRRRHELRLPLSCFGCGSWITGLSENEYWIFVFGKSGIMNNTATSVEEWIKTAPLGDYEQLITTKN